MKIQIFGLPRSGTTSLYEALRDNINYAFGIFEPINPLSSYKVITHEKAQKHLSIINECKVNIIEKNVITEFNDVLNFNFYTNYLKNFDKIIFLSRKNIKDHAKSVKIATVTDTWFDPYKDIDIEYDDYIPNIILQNQFLEKLSNHFKLPIFYYEDLYSNDAKYINPLLKFINIKIDRPDQFLHKIDNKHRLRQF